MKFLCDRCNTRYSIGDERVRGKILKIRCKHCANVITVREGMPVDESIVGPLPTGARAKPQTTLAPAALDEHAENMPLLGRVPTREVSGAHLLSSRDVSGANQLPASGMAPQPTVKSPASAALAARERIEAAKPPPPSSLQEEWYVSADGEQAGPFSLAAAQRWVGEQPAGAELHCWSEGFTDWLPVDKVSHFRGLRQRPAPPPPRPIPPRPSVNAPRSFGPAASPTTNAGVAPGPTTNSGRLPVASAPAPAANAAASANGPTASSTTGPRRTFGTTSPPRTNGAALVPSTPAREMAPLQAPADRAALGTRPPVDPFEDDELESKTQIGTHPLADASPPAPEPDDGATVAVAHRAAAAGTSPGVSSARTSDFGGDDLDIGEVSRVVNLADLARSARTQTPRASTAEPEAPAAPLTRMTGAHEARTTGAQPALRATGAQPALRPTGAQPAFRATGAQPAIRAATSAAPIIPASSPDSGETAPPPPSHRRHFIALGAVAVGVLGIVVVAALMLRAGPADESTSDKLGSVQNIDTSRPDDPVAHRPTTGGAAAGSATGPVATPTPTTPRPTQPHVARPTPTVPETPSGESLRSDEIEDTARKHQDMTQRCYMRSQRGADAILVGDVKKIAVTLAIAKDGTVTDVQLSDHAADSLGKCLSTSIRGWKFRPSSGGRFRFSLNFIAS